MSEIKSVNWTAAMLIRFRMAQHKAMLVHLESFMFDDNQYNTGYAGYLIEYLEEQFK